MFITKTDEVQWHGLTNTRMCQITELFYCYCNNAPLRFLRDLRSAVAADRSCSSVKESSYLYQLNLSCCINSPLCNNRSVQPLMLPILWDSNLHKMQHCNLQGNRTVVSGFEKFLPYNLNDQPQQRLTCTLKTSQQPADFLVSKWHTKDPFKTVIKAACSVTYYITYHSQSHGGSVTNHSCIFHFLREMR